MVMSFIIILMFYLLMQLWQECPPPLRFGVVYWEELVANNFDFLKLKKSDFRSDRSLGNHTKCRQKFVVKGNRFKDGKTF
jgi:hypothetical protein